MCGDPFSGTVTLAYPTVVLAINASRPNPAWSKVCPSNRAIPLNLLPKAHFNGFLMSAGKDALWHLYYRAQIKTISIILT